MTRQTTITKIKRKLYFTRGKAQQSIFDGVQNKIENIESSIFADVGNIGEVFLSKTPDTSDLDIEMWTANFNYRTQNNTAFSLGPAQVLREDVKHKMIPGIKTEQQTAYENLNGYIVRCLPNEFREEQARSVARDPRTGLQLNATDFRWNGDIAGTVCLGRAKNYFMDFSRIVLKGALKFIKFITATTPDAKIEYTPVEATIEGYDILIDIKGNKIVKVDTTVETKNV